MVDCSVFCIDPNVMNQITGFLSMPLGGSGLSWGVFIAFIVFLLLLSEVLKK